MEKNPEVNRYDLNDHLTALLSAHGWHASTEEDMDRLNDLVHEVADKMDELLAQFVTTGEEL